MCLLSKADGERHAAEFAGALPSVKGLRGVGCLALLAAVLAACESKPPVAFSENQSIPMGPYRVTVSHTESRAGPMFGGPGDPGVTSLVVHLNIQGADSDSNVERVPVGEWLARQAVVDSEGRRHRVIPMPTRNYFNMAEAMAARTSRDVENWLYGQTLVTGPTRDWVLIFPVPQDGRNFRLLMRNPDWVEGQPEVASVTLDR